jgi:glutamyl-tRNA synthetase
MASEKINELLLKYALQNAVKYRGKADASAIIGKIIQENPKLKSRAKEISKQAAEIVKKVNNIPLIEQVSELERIAPEMLEEKKHEKQEVALPELPNIRGKIVMRLAPFPSGALHIGNAKTYLLNALYAEKYNAKLLLVMDDTIGSEEKQVVPEAYGLIENAFQWLNVKYEQPVIYKSDRLQIYYKYAEEIIKKAKAYVCFCSAGILRKNREQGKECNCRGNTKEKNLKEWKNMLKGIYKEGQAVLRIKTSMHDKNPAFRDRVLFRISAREHPRVGKNTVFGRCLSFLGLLMINCLT